MPPAVGPIFVGPGKVLQAGCEPRAGGAIGQALQRDDLAVIGQRLVKKAEGEFHPSQFGDDGDQAGVGGPDANLLDPQRFLVAFPSLAVLLLAQVEIAQHQQRRQQSHIVVGVGVPAPRIGLAKGAFGKKIPLHRLVGPAQLFQQAGIGQAVVAQFSAAVAHVVAEAALALGQGPAAQRHGPSGGGQGLALLAPIEQLVRLLKSRAPGFHRAGPSRRRGARPEQRHEGDRQQSPAQVCLSAFRHASIPESPPQLSGDGRVCCSAWTLRWFRPS